MITRKVKSLDEDLRALGLIAEDEVANSSLLGEESSEESPEEKNLEEGEEAKEEEAGESVEEAKKACEGEGCPKSDDEEEEKDEEDEEKKEEDQSASEDVDDLEIDMLDEDDALESADVNMEMLDAISELPISEMDASDIADVLEALKEKNLPEGDDKLTERAEEIVNVLVMEAVAKKTRRSKAGSMAKKASFQCPQGTRKDPKDPAGRRCVKAAKAAGGAGKLAKEGRKKTRWGKSGGGQKSQKKSSRWAARREGVEISPFAAELAGLLENDDVQIEDVATIRGEIIDRIGSIMEMLHEEFMDENVTSVMEGAYECIVDAMEEGTLDESAMDEDAFIAELKTPLQLIAKSLGRIEQNEDSELGNE